MTSDNNEARSHVQQRRASSTCSATSWEHTPLGERLNSSTPRCADEEGKPAMIAASVEVVCFCTSSSGKRARGLRSFVAFKHLVSEVLRTRHFLLSSLFGLSPFYTLYIRRGESSFLVPSRTTELYTTLYKYMTRGIVLVRQNMKISYCCTRRARRLRCAPR